MSRAKISTKAAVLGRFQLLHKEIPSSKIKCPALLLLESETSLALREKN